MDKKILVLTHAESCSDVFDKTVDWLLLYSRSGRMNILSHDWSKKINEGWLPDGNFPIQLPERKDSVHSWFGDSPLTMIGFFTSQDVGSHLLSKDKIKTSNLGPFVYSSPCFCCIQTVKTVLDSWHAEQHIKIRIEPAFANFRTHHDVSGFPAYSTSQHATLSLKTVVDSDYVPVVKVHEWSAEETVEQFYNRQKESVLKIFAEHSGKYLFIVTHGANMLAIAHSLLGVKQSETNFNTKECKSIPRLSCCVLGEKEGAWKLFKSPIPSYVYKRNHFVDWNLCSAIHGRFCPFEMVLDQRAGFRIGDRCYQVVKFPENKNFVEMNRRSWHELGRKLCDQSMPDGRMSDFWFAQRHGSQEMIDEPMVDDTVKHLEPNLRFLRGIRMVNAVSDGKGKVLVDVKFSNETVFVKPFNMRNGWDENALKYAHHFDTNPYQHICSTVSHHNHTKLYFKSFPCTEITAKVDATLCEGFGTDDDVCKTFENSKCVCSEGYSGDLCQDDGDNCIGTPCKNYAVCEDYYKRYECICAPGYTGEHCEIDIDECASSPCKNKGVCHQFQDYYNCTCPTDFRGKHCEQAVGKCENVKCENGGECEEVENKYRCKCLFGYGGQHCEQVTNLCVSRPCQHEAECEADSKNFTCKCKPKFTGRLCEKQIEENIGRKFVLFGIILPTVVFVAAATSFLSYEPQGDDCVDVRIYAKLEWKEQVEL
ncbi:hEGF and His Phos 1 domain containing protein [Trichuris trichiura]|uniref:HEGF and His Phos 1 domain containing protein n=1 Tax=Trichuris trichiura TaxID=36087 RepID=A0A077YZZ0_TRITR|nr:hEGF and His Phos 1 domain containing protein [Trichuris trichiura]